MQLVPLRLAAFAALIVLFGHILRAAPINKKYSVVVEGEDSKAFDANHLATVVAAAVVTDDPFAAALQNKLSILNNQLAHTAKPKSTTVTSAGLYVASQTIRIKNVKQKSATTNVTPTATPPRNPKQHSPAK